MFLRTTRIPYQRYRSRQKKSYWQMLLPRESRHPEILAFDLGQMVAPQKEVLGR